MKFVSVFFLFLIYSSAAQDYVPLSDNAQLRADYLKQTEAIYKNSKSRIIKPYTKEFKQLYGFRYESLKGRVAFDYFIFNSEWNSYFNKIKKKVSKANPSFNFSDIRILISRDEEFNAYSVGEGTIILNIGLLNKIENESQLAFILCHEFSHYLLNHSDSAIYKRLASRHSAAYKAKIKELENAKYDQITELKKFIRQDIYMERRNSRAAERQADSLGLLLLTNAQYAPSGALTTIKLLEKNSIEPKYTQLNIFTYLGRKPTVEKASNFITNGKPKAEEDEEEEEESRVMLDSALMLTHPLLEERHKRLTGIILNTGTDTTLEIANSVTYKKIKENCVFEFCEALMKMGHYDQALLYALAQIEARPESLYFKEAAFFSYFSIYEARKSHHAGLMYDHPLSSTDSAMYWIKNYIVTIKLSDLLKDVIAFNKKYSDDIMETERNTYAHAMIALAQLDEKKYKSLKEKYIHSYPQGKYITKFIK